MDQNKGINFLQIFSGYLMVLGLWTIVRAGANGFAPTMTIAPELKARIGVFASWLLISKEYVLLLASIGLAVSGRYLLQAKGWACRSAVILCLFVIFYAGFLQIIPMAVVMKRSGVQPGAMAIALRIFWFYLFFLIVAYGLPLLYLLRPSVRKSLK